VRAIERAAHAARWVAAQGAPVLAADAVKVAGLRPGSGGSRTLRIAAEHGWITRDDRGSVLPGTEQP